MLGGMFSKKKSMLEALQMYPSISVENIKKEFMREKVLEQRKNELVKLE
jgi:hypothetical protein